MKILNENIEFNTNIICKNGYMKQISFNLNTEKLIAKIKRVYNDMLKENSNKEDYLFEIVYEKNGKEIEEQFENIYKLIYRIKTI